MIPSPKTRSTTGERFTKIETSLDRLAGALNSFVNESREYRRFQDAERDKMWNAIQQSDRSRSITWPMIFTAITVFLAVLGAAAKVGHTFTEMRAQQIEEKVLHVREISELRSKELALKIDRLDAQ